MANRLIAAHPDSPFRSPLGDGTGHFQKELRPQARAFSCSRLSRRRFPPLSGRRGEPVRHGGPIHRGAPGRAGNLPKGCVNAPGSRRSGQLFMLSQKDFTDEKKVFDSG